MKRRNAIKSLSAVTIGMALFPGCSDKLELDLMNGQIESFNDQQSIWIDAMSDAILPKGEEAITTLEGFPEFVLKMINFDKSEKDQVSFFNGYNQCTSDVKHLFEATTKELTADQIINYFTSVLSDEEGVNQVLSEEEKQNQLDKKAFCQTLRSLSIKHLITSKEYQEQVLEYKLVPNSFQSCIEV